MTVYLDQPRFTRGDGYVKVSKLPEIFTATKGWWRHVYEFADVVKIDDAGLIIKATNGSAIYFPSGNYFVKTTQRPQVGAILAGGVGIGQPSKNHNGQTA